MRIWVVDDEPGILQVMEVALTWRGHQVTTYQSAKLADRAASGRDERIPDLLLIDVSLGGEDGVALAGRLHAIWPMVPLVLMSGGGLPLAEPLSFVTQWLEKPFHLAQLAQTVERCRSG